MEFAGHSLRRIHLPWAVFKIAKRRVMSVRLTDMQPGNFVGSTRCRSSFRKALGSPARVGHQHARGGAPRLAGRHGCRHAKVSVWTAQALKASNRRKIRFWRCTRSLVAIFCRTLEISGVRGLLRPSCACRATGTFSTSSRPSATFCFPDRAQHHRCPPRLLAVVQIQVLIAAVLAVHMASSL